MDISKFLCKTIGIYLLIVSLAMLLNMQHFLTAINALIHDVPLLFVTGFFTLILGVMLVVTHNIWQWHWRVLITITGWLTLLKGLMLIINPNFMAGATTAYLQNINIAYLAAGIDFLLGVVFIYLGYFAHEK